MNNQILIEEYKKEFKDRFPNYFESNYTKALSIISISDKGKLVNQNISQVDDILLDNYGIFITAILAQQSFQLRDDSDVPINLSTLSTTGGYNMENGQGGLGAFLRIGTGTTPATRQDFNIENQFGGDIPLSGTAGYNSGLAQISITGSQVAGSAGSITETGLFNRWRATNSIHNNHMISHDLLTPVAFIIGQTITVNYIILLS